MTRHAYRRSAAPEPPRHSRAYLWRAGIVLVGVVAVAAGVTPAFRAMHTPDLIARGPGVGAVTSLSAWHRALAGTPGDTPVYELRGARPGGTVLVLGGTHADEPAGYLAAVVLVEQAIVEAGRVIVIPRANASGFTHNYPQEAHPDSFAIDTPSGARRFAYGARATNPVHQWPDPQVYTLPGSGQALSGSETRNLNRAYPGRADGTLTEQVAFAITTLIRRERVDLAIDLHEASPEYPVVNTIVTHQRAEDLAATANMRMQAADIAIGLETSPVNLHGLSHREWGDATPAFAVLMESTNPAQGRLRGATTAALVTGGRDRFYVLASARGRLSVPFPDAGWPLSTRVARHLAGLTALAAALGDLYPDKALSIRGVPEYGSIVARGLGAYLSPSMHKDGNVRVPSGLSAERAQSATSAEDRSWPPLRAEELRTP